MFSGIVENMVVLLQKQNEGSNMHFSFKSDIASELKVDQSVSHNGVCLTVTEIVGDEYKVTAIEETLNLSNLGLLELGDKVNIERCLRLSDRLDGHIVQGHIDGTAEIDSIEEKDGSWIFHLRHKLENRLIIHKGSICLNGVSLTVANCAKNAFSVAVIPYTFEHTNFHLLRKGDKVNVELDVLGKYILAANLYKD